MWGKEPGTEAKRLIELRTSALEALRLKPDFIDGEPYFEKTEAIRFTAFHSSRVLGEKASPARKGPATSTISLPVCVTDS